MKKLLMGSIALTAFSISMIIFQISCKKEANAQTSTGLTQQNILLFRKIIDNGGVRTDELWTSNYDGSNLKKIPVSLAGFSLPDRPASLSPDGKTVFMSLRITATSERGIYTCGIDGTNFKKIITATGNETHVEVNGAY